MSATSAEVSSTSKAGSPSPYPPPSVPPLNPHSSPPHSSPPHSSPPHSSPPHISHPHPSQSALESTQPFVWDKLTLSKLKHLVAGGVAGAISRTTVSPLERMKILYQLQTETVKHERRFQGIIPSLIRIGREEGVVGYFKGNGTNVVRIIPYVAVQFAAYEEFKKVRK